MALPAEHVCGLTDLPPSFCFPFSSFAFTCLPSLLTTSLAAGSRALVFSQYTLTLDVLEEYCKLRFGPEGAGFLR